MSRAEWTDWIKKAFVGWILYKILDEILDAVKGKLRTRKAD